MNSHGIPSDHDTWRDSFVQFYPARGFLQALAILDEHTMALAMVGTRLAPKLYASFCIEPHAEPAAWITARLHVGSFAIRISAKSPLLRSLARHGERRWALGSDER